MTDRAESQVGRESGQESPDNWLSAGRDYGMRLSHASRDGWVTSDCDLVGVKRERIPTVGWRGLLKRQFGADKLWQEHIC